jgi:hypothetical protein
MIRVKNIQHSEVDFRLFIASEKIIMPASDAIHFANAQFKPHH